jgi:hypothetical protein
VHYRIHNSLPPVSILSHINPAHAYHSASWRSILILFSHLRIGIPSGSFPQVSSPKPCMHFPISPIRATCRAHLISLLHMEDVKCFYQTLRLHSLITCPAMLHIYLSIIRISTTDSVDVSHHACVQKGKKQATGCILCPSEVNSSDCVTAAQDNLPNISRCTAYCLYTISVV